MTWPAPRTDCIPPLRDLNLKWWGLGMKQPVRDRSVELNQIHLLDREMLDRISIVSEKDDSDVVIRYPSHHLVRSGHSEFRVIELHAYTGQTRNQRQATTSLGRNVYVLSIGARFCFCTYPRYNGQSTLFSLAVLHLHQEMGLWILTHEGVVWLLCFIDLV